MNGTIKALSKVREATEILTNQNTSLITNSPGSQAKQLLKAINSSTNKA